MARFEGTAEDDFYSGTAGRDVILGRDGDDTLSGGGGSDRISGGDGADTIRGGDGDDRLEGGDGDDIVYGDAGNDTVNGGAGDDLLRGGDGIDTLDGGSGNDRISFFYPDATQGVVADLRNQTIANDGFGNVDTITSIEGLGAGTVFADLFYGSDVDNQLFVARNDRVYGFDGDDDIQAGDFGGAIADGGGGVDSISFSGSRDVVVDGTLTFELATRGIIVDLGRGVILEDGFGGRGSVISIENIAVLGGPPATDRLTGSDTANTLSGNFGDDVLRGQDGDDRLIGGQGRDRLQGGAGSDAFVFSSADWSGEGVETDTISDFRQGASGDAIDLEAGYGAAGDPISAFRFIGTATFSGAAGEARYEIRGDNTFVYLETDGVAGADHVIKLVGAVALTEADFQL